MKDKGRKMLFKELRLLDIKFQYYKKLESQRVLSPDEFLLYLTVKMRITEIINMLFYS